MPEEFKMMLKLQKRLAASMLKCSPKRVVFNPARLEDIKEAITKTDIRLLIGGGVIAERPSTGVSRARANKRKNQKKKGLRRGEGSRKGKFTARSPSKEAWMNKIRAQRMFLKYLRSSSLIKQEDFKQLYSKSKGGFFRSIKHIKLYLNEHSLLLKSTSPSKQKDSLAMGKEKTRPVNVKSEDRIQTK
jgi:large subunit ribosomal protein L19e